LSSVVSTKRVIRPGSRDERDNAPTAQAQEVM
jgi:hypothetical protein